MKLALLTLLCVIWLAISTLLHPARATAGNLEQPNVVWLISEDNSTHYLNLYDEHGTETPEIAKLAKHGLLFENAFSNSPVCSVARSTLISGCYSPRVGMQYHRRYKMVPMPDRLKLFPTYLRQAGYYTSNNVKTDYNAVEKEKVWDAVSRSASWKTRKPDQPFFHQQSFTATHESSLHFSAKSMKNDKTKTDPDTVFVAPYHPDTPTFRYTNARYRDNIQHVDAQIGKVVEQLRQEGLLEETFIFYFGDHGGVLPRGKGYAYESGLHAPLVVRIPENFKHLSPAIKGTRIPGFVSFIDFAPTVLSLAGIKVPPQIDGHPFLGQGVTLAGVNQNDFSFGHADRFDEKYDLVRTIRKGKFEYIRNFQPFNVDGLQNNYRYRMLAYQECRQLYNEGKLNAAQSQFFRRRTPEALYDLKKDPHEVTNLASDPQYAKQLLQMRKLMQQTLKQMPDLSLYPENYLVEHAFENPVAFGQAHQKEISRLLDIADLPLQNFPDAKPGLELALNSKNDWDRYWGLIACSCFEKQATPFIEKAKSIASQDENQLVRARAAEFLGLIEAVDPAPILIDTLKQSRSPIEAVLILNSVVLLRDTKPGYQFEITEHLFSPQFLQFQDIQRRLDYLDPKYKLPPKKKWKKKKQPVKN